MNELQIFDNEEFGQVRMVEIDGKPYFVGKDVANALGYSNPRDAISRHCKGVVKHDTPTSSGIQSISYINEGDMYRLITHSKLESAERFESWVFDEVLPTLRKTGSYEMPQNKGNNERLADLSPQLQLLINMEMKQKEHDEKLEELDNKVDSIKEVVALRPNAWRKESSNIINKIAQKLGGYEHIKLIREESYRTLEERMHVLLNIRLANKKKTNALNGMCKSKLDKLNQLDVIADDPKLIEGYIAIIKEMAIKYGISVGEVA